MFLIFRQKVSRTGVTVTLTVTVKKYKWEILQKLKWDTPNIYRSPQKNFETKSQCKIFHGRPELIAQLNLFVFGYSFVELVVGTPVDERNFLYAVLVTARGILGPRTFKNRLPICI